MTPRWYLKKVDGLEYLTRTYFRVIINIESKFTADRYAV